LSANSRTDRIIGGAILFLLIVGCFLVLAPFLTDLLWAVVLAYTSWPLYVWLRRRLGGWNNLAALLMTLFMVVIVLAPFAIAASAIADNVDRIAELGHRFFEQELRQPPDWVAGLPVVGNAIAEYWLELVQDTDQLGESLRALTPTLRTFVLKVGQGMGAGLLHLALAVFFTFFLFRGAEGAVVQLRAVTWRLGGARAVRLLEVAGGTVQSVVYGILGTALAQGMLAAIGFAIAGVPGAPLLGLATFFLSIVPVGPPLIWLPAAIWVYAHGHTGWAIFVLLWGLLVVSGVDNILKPMLISRGTHMPFIMVFLGVLGGALAFGFIGVFLGPTLLAVAYRLLMEWSQIPDSKEAA
jgi:predicted PurR-regulated permease PerM